MIDPSYAGAQIVAVLKMTWDVPGWADELDRSVDGVFRSFSAMLLVAPFFALSFASGREAARLADAAAPPAFPAFVSAHTIGAYADWCLTLVILAAAARALGASRRAAEVIAGYNWLQVPLAAMQAAASATIFLPDGRNVAAIAVLPAVVIVFASLWGYLRRALALDPAWTVVLILLLTIAGLLTQTVVSGAVLGLVQLFS